MSKCQNSDHERFRGVFFAKNGCLACEVEHQASIKRGLLEIIRTAIVILKDGGLASATELKVREVYEMLMTSRDFILQGESSDPSQSHAPSHFQRYSPD